MVNGEIEYLFPPLYQFVEYRTFERFNGNNVVYTMLINAGIAPSSGTWKEVSTGVKDAKTVLRMSTIFERNPKAINISYIFRDDLRIRIESSEYEQVPNVFVQIWYIKKS